ncbi:MAG TPA: chloride channel protein, partial [Candidatus Acidoferrum sp.]|nr:chloride channel protein [Candidatus Acidoferrum sp.]
MQLNLPCSLPLLPEVLTIAQDRTTSREASPRMLLEASLIGVIGGLSAQLFMLLLRFFNHIFLYDIAGYRPPGLEGGRLFQTIGPHGLWLIPVATTLGGLISGFIVYRWAPEAEGHGTDTVVYSFHRKEGVIRPRVSPIKMIASAVTIGSGGSAGREGPIALIAAGAASVYSQLLHHSERDRRLLVLAGMAAGLSAIFRSPMGTAVFAIEVLYSRLDFETDALLYTMLSSIVAYTINGLFVGFRPLFRTPTIPTPSASTFPWYVVFGLAAGAVATILPEVFYKTRDLFRAIPIPIYFKPALGGLCVGLLGVALPQVLGGGYGWIQLSIDGKLALRLLAVLILAKLLAFALTVSSGGSGGVFAPSLFVGAALGGTFAALLHKDPATFVVVGMAAVFGGAARVPIATMLMVTEMTQGYHLLLPAGITVMISYLLQAKIGSTLNLKYRSLYEGQVPNYRDSPAHYRAEIQTALNLLGSRNVPAAEKVHRLDLLRLLRSRIRFDLPGHRVLTLGIVKEGTPLVGKPLGTLYERLAQCDFEVVAVMRREHVVLPHPDTIIEPGDRVVVITSPEARAELGQLIEPLPEVGPREPHPP